LKPFVDVENHHFPRIPNEFLYQRSVNRGRKCFEERLKADAVRSLRGWREGNECCADVQSFGRPEQQPAGGIRNEGRRIEISKRGRKQDPRNE
jgi:hypothetical protein